MFPSGFFCPRCFLLLEGIGEIFAEGISCISTVSLGGGVVGVVAVYHFWKGGQVSFEDATHFIPQSRGSSSALGFSFALVVVHAT